jgi:hypothetical protein
MKKFNIQVEQFTVNPAQPAASEPSGKPMEAIYQQLNARIMQVSKAAVNVVSAEVIKK